MAIHRPEVLFRDAATAASCPPSTLRNWLDRGQVTLAADVGRDGGWRRFTPLDVVRLALIKTLVDFGFTVRAADAALVAHYDRRAENAAAIAEWVPDIGDAGALHQMNGWHLVATPDGRIASLMGALPHEKMFFIQGGETTELPNPGWRAEPGSEWFLEDTPPAFLTIRVESLAKTVLARLKARRVDD